MKIKLLLLVIIVICSSCGKKPILSGNIDGLGNDTIFVAYRPLSNLFYNRYKIRDTILTIEGKFNFNKNIKEPHVISLIPKRTYLNISEKRSYPLLYNDLEFILEPNKPIYISGEVINHHINLSVHGSSLNEKYADLRNDYIGLMDSIAETNISLEKTNNESERIGLFNKRDSFYDLLNKHKIEYIDNELNQDLSAFLISHQNYEIFLKYYPKLSENVKNGIFKNILIKKKKSSERTQLIYANKEKIKIGTLAPSFELFDNKNVLYKPNYSKSEFTILDFWGTWCSPCIAEIPDLFDLYNKYEDKIQIIGIACNDDKTKWKAFLESNKIPWVSLLNDDNIKNDISVKFGVTRFPTKIVINKFGKVILKPSGFRNETFSQIDSLINLK